MEKLQQLVKNCIDSITNLFQTIESCQTNNSDPETTTRIVSEARDRYESELQALQSFARDLDAQVGNRFEIEQIERNLYKSL